MEPPTSGTRYTEEQLDQLIRNREDAVERFRLKRRGGVGGTAAHARPIQGRLTTVYYQGRLTKR